MDTPSFQDLVWTLAQVQNNPANGPFGNGQEIAQGLGAEPVPDIPVIPLLVFVDPIADVVQDQRALDPELHCILNSESNRVFDGHFLDSRVSECVPERPVVSFAVVGGGFEHSLFPELGQGVVDFIG